MKIAGILLIIIGILMIVFREVSFTKKEKVVDLGPVEINRTEKKELGWPAYAGGIAILGGAVLLISSARKK